MLLEAEGFVVIPAHSFGEAVRACERAGAFDLIIIGHSIPRTEKEKFFPEFKKKCSGPVLSIRKHGESPLPGVDYSMDSHDGPQVLIETVKRATKQKGKGQ